MDHLIRRRKQLVRPLSRSQPSRGKFPVLLLRIPSGESGAPLPRVFPLRAQRRVGEAAAAKTRARSAP